MVTEIRLYIEGGGDSRDTKAFLRQGFSIFFGQIVQRARNKNVRWQLIMCGSRNSAFDAFRTSVRQRPDTFHVLLIDAEGPVQATPWDHLRQRGEWHGDGAHDEHCHLMVQTMEAWFVADIKVLVAFYGAGFNANHIPRNPDVEQISKDQLRTSLRAASSCTQKGEYHKIQHAYKLLGMIDVGTVREASRHCDRLFVTLTAKMA